MRVAYVNLTMMNRAGDINTWPSQTLLHVAFYPASLRERERKFKAHQKFIFSLLKRDDRFSSETLDVVVLRAIIHCLCLGIKAFLCENCDLPLETKGPKRGEAEQILFGSYRFAEDSNAVEMRFT